MHSVVRFAAHISECIEAEQGNDRIWCALNRINLTGRLGGQRHRNEEVFAASSARGGDGLIDRKSSVFSLGTFASSPVGADEC